jgi:hypothetical protein
MAVLTFPINPDGLSLDALVGLDHRASHALLGRGAALPRPQRVRALLDSGTDLTAVSAPVLSRLPVTVTRGRPVRTHTTSGIIHTPTFYISLSIPPAPGAAGSLLVVARLRVNRLPVPLPALDVLIGLDVIRQYLWAIDGPGGNFSVTF